MLPSKKKSPGGLLHKQKSEAQQLGQKVAIGAVTTVIGAPLLGLLISPTLGTILGLGAFGYTGYKAWQWIQYRAKWGLRF